MEIWKTIKGFEKYQISNHGRLKSFHRDNNGTILSPYSPVNNYKSVILSSNGIKKNFRIHGLVAVAFIGEKLYQTRKIDIDHIDGNKHNNHIDNIRYLDKKSHFKKTLVDYPDLIKPMVKYNTEIRPKTILQFDLAENFIQEFKSAKEASRKTGVVSRNILMVANGTYYNVDKKLKRRQAGGFIWKFKNESNEA